MSVTEDWAAQCIQDGVVEVALQAWTAEINKGVYSPDASCVWPDDWSAAEQHIVRMGMEAAIKAATAALRAENERLLEAIEYGRGVLGECVNLRAENERLREALMDDRHAMILWLDKEYRLPGCDERIDAIEDALSLETSAVPQKP